MVRILLTNIYIISHLIIGIFDSIKFILHHSQILLTFILFYHITPTEFTMKRKSPKDRSCNKYKKEEEPRTKIPFVSRGG